MRLILRKMATVTGLVLLGVLIGVTYFDANVTSEDDLEKTEVSYGYDGAFIGLHVVF